MLEFEFKILNQFLRYKDEKKRSVVIARLGYLQAVRFGELPQTTIAMFSVNDISDFAKVHWNIWITTLMFGHLSDIELV